MYKMFVVWICSNVKNDFCAHLWNDFPAGRTLVEEETPGPAPPPTTDLSKPPNPLVSIKQSEFFHCSLCYPLNAVLWIRNYPDAVPVQDPNLGKFRIWFLIMIRTLFSTDFTI